MKPELLDGTPPDSWAECNKKGWITQEIFIKRIKKFIWSRATKEDPVLLLLDGHSSHVKSLELIDIARENGVIILFSTPLYTPITAVGCQFHETIEFILWRRS